MESLSSNGNWRYSVMHFAMVSMFWMLFGLFHETFNIEHVLPFQELNNVIGMVSNFLKKVLGNLALSITATYCLIDFIDLFGGWFIDESEENFVGIDNLFHEQLILLERRVFLHRYNSDDGVQLCIHFELIIKPKLFNCLSWIRQYLSRVSETISLYHNISDIGVVQYVLYSCHEVISIWVHWYLALQQMHPLGSYKKLLKGTPDSSIIKGCSIPIWPSAN